MTGLFVCAVSDRAGPRPGGDLGREDRTAGRRAAPSGRAPPFLFDLTHSESHATNHLGYLPEAGAETVTRETLVFLGSPIRDDGADACAGACGGAWPSAPLDVRREAARALPGQVGAPHSRAIQCLTIIVLKYITPEGLET